MVLQHHSYLHPVRVAYDPNAPYQESNSQLRESVTHDAGVVGVEQPAHLGIAGGERSEKQHAVGDALRAGKPHLARRAADRLRLEAFHQDSNSPSSQRCRAARASVNSFSSPAESAASTMFLMDPRYFE